MRSLTLLLALCLLSFGSPASAQSGSGSVTVYRCTDAAGKVSLGSLPCAAGQAQVVREMQRPQAPPPQAPAPPPAPPRQAAPVVVENTVYLAPPRPMYECITPDGKRYASDDGRGNPRWVPLWTLGYPALRPSAVPGRNIGNPDAEMHLHRRDVNWPVATGGGTWVRDDCAMLPPREACARLRDRRSDIRTRFFNAQEKERDVLRNEERGINARLDNDCGGR
ncbi:DUF4124 domain-containing protein [Thermomonas paludicola]|uniref:DUF4124 domain-containing protein n=1 Tax=Thermomonas paludicola TaxID=2884874 RepID=UPI0021143BD4|nr:DUF4124 domain-containing protein [Thermomonas paludicola]